MSKKSETSFASRIARAEKFYQHLMTFEDFAPGEDDLTPASYRTLIDAIKATNTQHGDTQYDFIGEAKERAKVFNSNPDSLAKVATLVKSYTRGKFKRDSHEFLSVEKLVSKMRGEKPARINTATSEQTISQTERSFGAQLVNFEDIVAIVSGLGTKYVPANPTIKLTQLEAFSALGNDKNNSVANKFAIFKPLIKKRWDVFTELEDRSTRIKDMVKSQYSLNSSQYKLVKGLNFSV